MKVLWSGPEEGLRHELLKANASLSLENITLEDLFKKKPDDSTSLCLLHPSLFETAKLFLKFEPESVNLVGYFDGFVKENGKWVPWCSYGSVFQKLLGQKNKFLDLNRGCLIVGNAFASRSVVVELFRMGFRNFLVLREDNSLPGWFESQTRHLFGIQTEVVSPKNLVHLSGESSILVYGVKGEAHENFEIELSYLNFLNRPGLVLDFNRSSFLNRILQETQDEALAQITVQEIETESIAVWLSKSKP